MTLLANAERLAHEAIAVALKPNPPVDYLAWAEANVVFDDASPFPGPWNRTLFPYFDEILRALSPQDPCRFVTLCSSAQLGKTEIGKIFALGSVVMSRGTVLVCHPTIENASRWSRIKLQPSMRSIPVVAELSMATKSRYAGTVALPGTASLTTVRLTFGAPSGFNKFTR